MKTYDNGMKRLFLSSVLTFLIGSVIGGACFGLLMLLFMTSGAGRKHMNIYAPEIIREAGVALTAVPCFPSLIYISKSPHIARWFRLKTTGYSRFDTATLGAGIGSTAFLSYIEFTLGADPASMCLGPWIASGLACTTGICRIFWPGV